MAVPHRALYASVNARPAVYPEPIRAALLSFPLIFDGSVLGLFATLTRGATVVLPDPRRCKTRCRCAGRSLPGSG